MGVKAVEDIIARGIKGVDPGPARQELAEAQAEVARCKAAFDQERALDRQAEEKSWEGQMKLKMKEQEVRVLSAIQQAFQSMMGPMEAKLREFQGAIEVLNAKLAALW